MPNAILFPHLVATGPAPSHRDVSAAHREYFLDLVEDGSIRPLIFHYHFSGCLLLIAYLLIPHTTRPWVYRARWLVLAWNCWWGWKTLWETSSVSSAVNFIVGLTAAWNWVYSWTWLVFYRPQWDARRVKRRTVEAKAHRHHQTWAKASAARTGHGRELDGKTGPEASLTANARRRTRSQERERDAPSRWNGTAAPTETIADEYFWEPYPDNFRERLPWLCDLLINFRLPGWNIAIPQLPPPPPAASRHPPGIPRAPMPRGRSHTGLRRCESREDVFWTYVPRFVLGYLVLDLIKTIAIHDPFFLFGPTTYALPPFLARLSPILLYAYRQIMTMAAILTALETGLSLSPIVFCLLLGPPCLGEQAEPWYYSTHWGSVSNIFSRGLNGFWSSWWHQLFRFVFSAPTYYLVRVGAVSAGSQAFRLLQLLFAFAISGVLHAAGSVTTLPHTRPCDFLAFFLLQALGIFLQTVAASRLRPHVKSCPSILRRAGNFVFTVAWLLSTSWLLVDEFARGAVWLFEPVPISLLRGLGFGVEGDGWWCWEYMGSGWYRGRWWDSGMALF
ncbi:membrane bound O-acyl transferase family-domain-containing protein [Amylocarpus encephaloides]|uniref:Membrane bound O-acyl transferase family-domain-containing protein n=1 Tax=Amylocarpus encephaloides TaxID=45428 RepID=A0A9P8C8M6_9HELO|nr:membrane bound O-acyl transferase family-domain-containing protein [Amylocarpus encephaloides]